MAIPLANAPSNIDTNKLGYIYNYMFTGLSLLTQLSVLLNFSSISYSHNYRALQTNFITGIAVNAFIDLTSLLVLFVVHRDL